MPRAKKPAPATTQIGETVTFSETLRLDDLSPDEATEAVWERLREFMQLNGKSRTAELFRELDGDRSGKVGTAELTEFLEVLNVGGLSPEVLSAVISRMDPNGDGELDFKELKAGIEKVPLTSKPEEVPLSETEKAKEEYQKLAKERAEKDRKEAAYSTKEKAEIEERKKQYEKQVSTLSEIRNNGFAGKAKARADARAKKERTNLVFSKKEKEAMEANKEHYQKVLQDQEARKEASTKEKNAAAIQKQEAVLESIKEKAKKQEAYEAKEKEEIEKNKQQYQGKLSAQEAMKRDAAKAAADKAAAKKQREEDFRVKEKALMEARKKQYADLIHDQEARTEQQRAAKLAERNAKARDMDAQHKALAQGHKSREAERKARYAQCVEEAKAKRNGIYKQRYDALATERAARDRAAKQYGAQAESEATKRSTRWGRFSGENRRATSADDAAFQEAKRAGLTCLNDHRLKRFHTPYPDFACSVCAQSFKESTLMFGCRECDYDVCKGCLAKHPSASSRGPAESFEQRKARAQSLDNANRDSSTKAGTSGSSGGTSEPTGKTNRNSVSSSALNMSVADGKGKRAPKSCTLPFTTVCLYY